MLELPVATLTSDGLHRGGRPWLPVGSWVGAVGLAATDRRASLLAVAARARDEGLSVVTLDPDGENQESFLTLLAGMPPDARPRGLLLGEAWQEVVAARCNSLSGAAADLGLADAVRLDDDESWHGHHLIAGAVEAFLAQVWPESGGELPRAVVLGDGPVAMVAALVAARRGALAVTVIATEQARRDDLAARFASAVDWPSSTVWQVSDRLDRESPAAGLWIRAGDLEVADGIWLPDAAGDAPCVLVDLAGETPDPPLGFAHPVASGVQVMAAGLAAAWYLGPPIPWDALTAAEG